jgi:hypothetical protein
MGEEGKKGTLIHSVFPGRMENEDDELSGVCSGQDISINLEHLDRRLKYL